MVIHHGALRPARLHPPEEVNRCGALGWDRIFESFTCELPAEHAGDHGAHRGPSGWFAWADDILTPTLFP